jgi:hypothetical protein
MSHRIGPNSISSSLPSPSTPAIPALWVTIVMVGAILLTAGGIIALVHPIMLVSPGDQINSAVHTYAGYLASRNIALAIMLLALLAIRAKIPLASLMILIALVQLIDAGIDCSERRWSIVPGILIFALIFCVGAARLTGYPFWKREAWRALS